MAIEPNPTARQVDETGVAGQTPFDDLPIESQVSQETGNFRELDIVG